MKMALIVNQGSGTLSQYGAPKNAARGNAMLNILNRGSGTSRENPTSKHVKKKKHGPGSKQKPAETSDHKT